MNERADMWTAISPWLELTRLPKVAGSLLIFWPFAWSLAMLARSTSMVLSKFLYLNAYGLVGASLLHSAGCIWNDILDVDLDRQVERTKRRPLVDGRVSMIGATIFLLINLQLLLAMSWKASPSVWYLCLLSIFPLPALYPLMKRWTFWPSAWLGLSVNVGPMLIFPAMRESVIPVALLLFCGSWFWTLWYDTIYGCQDRLDDTRVGIKSTARLFGDKVKPILVIFGVCFIALLALSGLLLGQGPAFFLTSVSATILELISQLRHLDPSSPESALRVFERNALRVGPLVWAGLLIDYLLA